MSNFSHGHHRFYANYDEQHNLLCKQVCFIKEGAPIPGHGCVGDNRIFPFDGYIHLGDMFDYVTQNQLEPIEIDFKDIWYAIRSETEIDDEKKSERYQLADPDFPGMVSPIRNPDNKPYRMLDGRRRLWKLQEQGISKAMFYVVPEPDIYRFFWMLLPQRPLFAANK